MILFYLNAILVIDYVYVLYWELILYNIEKYYAKNWTRKNIEFTNYFDRLLKYRD